jgi:transcriptional regulator with XRE-family HTH domain
MAKMQVGQILRDWRGSRGLSQLDLAMQAGFSARHVSFIETGRAQPSRQALLVLAESLDMPLRERNRLLEAGGYAHVFQETPFGAEEMAHVRSTLQFILDRHSPYGAVVLDRYGNVLMGNAASLPFMSRLVESHLLAPPVNILRAVFHPDGMRRFIVNWNEVAHHLLDRARRELGSTNDDPVGAKLLKEIEGYAPAAHRNEGSSHLKPADLLLPVHLRRDGIEVRLFTTIMTLGTPRDVTLQELRLESYFPADQASEEAWRALAADIASGDPANS